MLLSFSFYLAFFVFYFYYSVYCFFKRDLHFTYFYYLLFCVAFPSSNTLFQSVIYLFILFIHSFIFFTVSVTSSNVIPQRKIITVTDKRDKPTFAQNCLSPPLSNLISPHSRRHLKWEHRRFFHMTITLCVEMLYQSHLRLVFGNVHC